MTTLKGRTRATLKTKVLKNKTYFGVCGSPGPDHPPPPPFRTPCSSALHAIMTMALSFVVFGMCFSYVFVFVV